MGVCFVGTAQSVLLLGKIWTARGSFPGRSKVFIFVVQNFQPPVDVYGGYSPAGKEVSA